MSEREIDAVRALATLALPGDAVMLSVFPYQLPSIGPVFREWHGYMCLCTGMYPCLNESADVALAWMAAQIRHCIESRSPVSDEARAAIESVEQALKLPSRDEMAASAQRMMDCSLKGLATP